MKYLRKVHVGPMSVEAHGQSVKGCMPKSLYKNKELVYFIFFSGFIDTGDYYQNVNMSYFCIFVVTRKTPKML
jgi:hypothetical protein